MSLDELALHNFYYRWSHTSFCNTAVFGMISGSTVSTALLRYVLTSKNTTDAASRMHPRLLFNDLQGTSAKKDIEYLPSTYFDPTWYIWDLRMSETMSWSKARYHLGEIGKSFFHFQPEALDYNDFFPGVFAFHWHNSFSKGSQNHSVADTFYKHFVSQQSRYARVSTE